MISDHVVNQVHGSVLRGVRRPRWNEATHAGEAVDESQDAVERRTTVDGRVREPVRPVHVQMLPAEIRRADELCRHPLSSFHGSDALACHAGSHAVIDVTPHATPVAALLDP